ncbi:MAG TPA: hypothetical protein IAC03_04790 [Candidatus Coprenecus pullistercoris]|nr:hypothetical protein [Candidatus Coprenecus pullistercoris]
MKRNIFLSTAAVASALLLSACQITEVSDSQKTRSITVWPENVDTRTSIEYEYSDYSHLVWSEGDTVAYVTDCASDIVKEAEVSEGGYFTAEIPAEADAGNRLYVVYPGKGLAGKSLSGLTLEIKASQTQDTISTVNSNGIEIPMLASTQVPDAVENSVSVRYYVPVSVIRFCFLSGDFSSDRIQSVTFTAPQPAAGTIDVVKSVDGEVIFNGTSNSVTTTVAKLSPIERGGYVYLPVMRGSYSGVTLEVITDNNKFVFNDGNFELDDPDAALYKVEMTLGETQVIKEPYFAEISEGEQFSADNKYLITYKESSSSYRVASKHISSKIDAKVFDADADLGGIAAVGEVMDYVFTIAPVSDEDGLYWLYSEAAGNSNGNYIGTAGGTSTAGNFFFQNTEPTSSSNYYIWQITYGDGVQYIYNEGRSRWFKYSDDLKQFCTSSVGEDNTGNEEICDITILKLIE